MAGRNASVSIRYVVDVLDRGSRKLLATDRALRASAQQTGAALRKQGQDAARAADATAGGARRVVAAERQATQAIRGRARAAQDANRRLERSQAALAKRAVATGVAVAASYRAYAAAKGAVTQTVELAKATKSLQAITGQDTRSASAWASMARLRGVESQKLNRSFLALSKQITAAKDGSDKSVKGFAALGVSLRDLQGLGTEEVLLKVADGMKGMEDPARRAALAQQLFGRAGTQLLPLLSKGSLGIREQLEVVRRLGATLGASGVRKALEFAAAQRTLKAATTGLKIEFATALLPTLTRVSKTATDVIATLRNPRLTGAQKSQRVSARVDPLIRDAQKLAEKVAPALANALARAAPQAAATFVRAFAAADVWGKVFVAAVILSKVGVFRTVGRVAAARFLTGYAPATVAGNAVGGMVGGIDRRGQRFKGAGHRAGKLFGRGLVVAALLALPLLLKEIEEAVMGKGFGRDPLRDAGVKPRTPLDSLAGKVRGALGFRRGGLVPAMVSPGEELVYGGRSMVVPGARTPADTVLAHVPPGTAVLTSSGRGMVDAGASIDEALRHQAPHFRAGGFVAPGARAAAAVDSRGRFSLRDLVALAKFVRMAQPALGAAIAMGESGGDPRINAYGPEDSRGLWQINYGVHRQFDGRRLYDPVYNAKAALQVSGGGRNWRPWTVFTRGTYRQWFAQAQRLSKTVQAGARAATGAAAGRVASGRFTLPERVDPRLGFRAGFDAALAGERISRSGALAPAVTAATFQRAARPAASGRSTTAAQGVPGHGILRPVTGSISGSFGEQRATHRHAGLDIAAATGTRILAMLAGKVTSAGWMGGYGNAVDLSHPGGWSSRYGHMSRILTRTGARVARGQPIGLVGSTGNSSGPHLHWEVRKDGSLVNPARYYRIGGRVGGIRRPTTTTRGLPGRGLPGGIGRVTGLPISASGSEVDAAIRALADYLDSLAVDQVEQLKARIAAQIKRLSSIRNPSAAQRELLQRMESVLYTVNTDLGRRVGEQLQAVTDALGAEDRRATVFTRGQFLAGVREDTERGQEAIAEFLAKQIGRLTAQRGPLQAALDAAKRHGDPETIKAVQDQLEALDDKIGQATVDKVAAQVAAIENGVREVTDRLDRDRTRFDAKLLLKGIAPDSAKGLGKLEDLLLGQFKTLKKTRDDLRSKLKGASGAAAEAIKRQMTQIGDQILQTTAQIADTHRRKVAAKLQEAVDRAKHRSSLAALGLTNLELRQRLAGGFDRGGAARAEFIRGTQVPAIHQEIAALQAQLGSAQGERNRQERDRRRRRGQRRQRGRERGRGERREENQELARNIAEEIAALQNSLLEREIEATEALKEELKEELREFAGSLVFELRGQQFSDAILPGLGA